ncbi:MAG: hypothetical protein JXA93_17805 [Anaerolineae bacterium]|nr:hypothetical protein [Anaerolineae bacterium]
MILVDWETRLAVANQPDAEGYLVPQGNVWVGSIPSDVILANTAVTWAGVHWTMVIWQSLSDDSLQRAEFMAHEAFHRIRGEIGFPMPEVPNANVHLDTLDGRYWLQLEWRALERALVAQDPTAAIGDALLFRAARRALFGRATTEERSLEMHEGLAEYTGFRLGQMTEVHVAEFVRSAPTRYPSFVPSFAYASGPAYGFLLDRVYPAWREELTSEHDLGDLLQSALSIILHGALSACAAARARVYDGDALQQSEVARDQQRKVEIATYRARLLDGPGLILPLTARVQCAFDPRATMPIPESGTVFPSIHVSDAWGILNVERGGLWISNDWRTARIVAADDLSSHRLSGDGWTLQLAEGWGIQAAERPGDVELVQ